MSHFQLSIFMECSMACCFYLFFEENQCPTIFPLYNVLDIYANKLIITQAFEHFHHLFLMREMNIEMKRET